MDVKNHSNNFPRKNHNNKKNFTYKNFEKINIRK